MFVRQFKDEGVKRAVKLASVGAGAGNDQRRARLVDQDAVHLIDHGKEVAALGHVLDRGFHVVAQVVKAQFVVGGIGDVAAVGGAFFGLWLVGVDDAGGQAKRRIDLAHPFRVALGQVVVDGDDMHALARQRVQVGGEGGDQGLALTGLHFGDIALMQEDPAHKLHVEGAQAKGAARRLAAVGEGFGQQLVQAFARHGALGHRLGPGHDLFVGQRGEFRLQRVDFRDQGQGCLDLAVIGRAKDLFRDRSDAQHVLSARVRLASSCETWPCPHPAPCLIEGRKTVASGLHRTRWRCKRQPSECQRRTMLRPVRECS